VPTPSKIVGSQTAAVSMILQHSAAHITPPQSVLTNMADQL